MKTKATTIILGIILSLFLGVNANAQQEAKTITDGHRTISYSSLPDVKRKIEEYSSWRRNQIFGEKKYDLIDKFRPIFPMEMLIDLLEKEPLASHFEFGFADVSEVTSPDMKIKCYELKANQVTAAGDLEGAIVISNGNAYEVIPVYDGPDCVLYTGDVSYIDCFKATDGKTIYAVEYRSGSTDLFILDGTKLLPMKLAVDYDRLNSIQKP